MYIKRLLYFVCVCVCMPALWVRETSLGAAPAPWAQADHRVTARTEDLHTLAKLMVGRATPASARRSALTGPSQD